MTNMKHLSRLPKLDKRAHPATQAFWAYDKEALAEGAIPKKYKELMAISVALTTQCTYCIEIHRKAALKAGATEAELAEAIHVAAILRAGAAITHGTHLLSEPIQSWPSQIQSRPSVDKSDLNEEPRLRTEERQLAEADPLFQH